MRAYTSRWASLISSIVGSGVATRDSGVIGGTRLFSESLNKMMVWGITIPRIEMRRGDVESPHPKRRKERDVRMGTRRRVSLTGLDIPHNIGRLHDRPNGLPLSHCRKAGR